MKSSSSSPSLPPEDPLSEFLLTPEQRAARGRDAFRRLLEEGKGADPSAAHHDYFPANRFGWTPRDPTQVQEATDAFAMQEPTHEVPLPPPRPEDEDIE